MGRASTRGRGCSLAKESLPLLAKSFVCRILNRILHGLLDGLDRDLVALEHLNELLHYIEPVGILDETLHNLDVAQSLHEALNCVEFGLLKHPLNYVGGDSHLELAA